MSPWRLLRDGPGEAAWNMALDEALLRHAASGVLRIYQWRDPAVSLGYFQEAAVAPAGRPFVRRYTGGGLVDHARDVTYTVVVPRHDALGGLSTAESYSRIHEAVAAALRRIGVEAELAASCDPEEADACFNRAVRFDVVHAGRKVAGAAQRRTRAGMLQQGSVLLPDPARNEALRAALPEAFAAALGVALEPGAPTEAERAEAETLVRERYGTEAWNRQR
ncbi:MAG: biotin/lipoate A/B protein ligase family protein [Verrucomicrobium sp.]|nr:biotin/lipoate A/B protein ligase family protein [Verrucomicrobium sp.]